MPVEFWIGSEFEYAHERKAQAQIVSSFRAAFDQAADSVVAVFNFFCNGRQFDLLVLKRDAIVVVDFKECDKPLLATPAGNWKIIGAGELPGNPFLQVSGFRNALRDFLRDENAKFLQPQKARLADFSHITAVVAVSPRKHSDTQNAIGGGYPWFRFVGLDELPAPIGQLTSKKFSFEVKELRTLVEHLLYCQPLKPPHALDPVI